MKRVLIIGSLAVWTAASVPLGMVIWPVAAGRPSNALLPFFVLVAAFEGAAFGLGFIWLAYGRGWLRSAGRSGRLTNATYMSIAWLFMNWWPHDGLHRSAFGQTFAGIATIDVTFHCTLIAATVVVAWFAAGGLGIRIEGEHTRATVASTGSAS
jgi:hypothetical protein